MLRDESYGHHRTLGAVQIRGKSLDTLSGVTLMFKFIMLHRLILLLIISIAYTALLLYS